MNQKCQKVNQKILKVNQKSRKVNQKIQKVNQKIRKVNQKIRTKIQIKKQFVCLHRSVQTGKEKQVKPKLDCYYHFPIDLVPNRISFGAKLIGNV